MPKEEGEFLEESLEKLQKLGELKLKGLLTDEEFQTLKKLVMDSLENKSPETLQIVSNLTTDFLLYENATHGIKIRHPSFWEGVELNQIKGPVTYIVEFRLPKESPSNLYGRYDAVVSIYVKKLYTVSISLQNLARKEIFLLRKYLKDFEIKETFMTRIGNMPAYKIVQSYTAEQIAIKMVNMRVWIVESDKLYCILYTTRFEQFNEILPFANKMIDSFELIGGYHQPPSEIEAEFLVYNNPELKIKIKYPSEWITEERYQDTNSDSSKDIAFLSRSDTNSDLFEDTVLLEIFDDVSHDLVLDYYVHTRIDTLMKKTPKDLNFRILESTPINISNNPGKKIVYKIEPSSGKEVKTTEVLLLRGNKGVALTYSAELPKYDKNLTLAEKMIDSLEVFD